MTDFASILSALAGVGVEFIVVGGVARVCHGAARATYDLEAIAELEALRDERDGG